MLEKEYSYYKAHKAELEKEFSGKFVIIVGEKPLGGFDSQDEALEFAVEKGHKLGEFLLQFCDPDLDQTQHFRTRAVFSASA